MPGIDKRRMRGLLAAVLALVFAATAACKSNGGDDVDAGRPAGGVGTTAAAVSTAESDTKTCGVPPCMRFVSRGDTKTLSETVSAHPILSSVALHAAVSVLCGGILCLMAEGVSVEYVGRQAKEAAQHDECLKVSILPNGREWQMVDVHPSNQSPYCTD